MTATTANPSKSTARANGGGTTEPPTGHGGGESKPQGRGFIITVFAVIGAIFIALITILVFGGGDDSNEELRLKAEAVLSARFNDTNADSFGPLESLVVNWEGDHMVATWVQSGPGSTKQCSAPVLVSPNQQQFGIAPFEAADLNNLDSAESKCIITTGLGFGLPLEEEPAQPLEE